MRIILRTFAADAREDAEEDIVRKECNKKSRTKSDDADTPAVPVAGKLTVDGKNHCFPWSLLSDADGLETGFPFSGFARNHRFCRQIFFPV